MSAHITRWPAQRITEFVDWHERVMADNGYGPTVVAELRAARDKFLVAVVPVTPIPDKT